MEGRATISICILFTVLAFHLFADNSWPVLYVPVSQQEPGGDRREDPHHSLSIGVEKLVLKTKTWEYANKYSLPKEKLLETFRLLFKIIKVLKRAINRVLLSLYPSFCTHWQNNSTTFCFTMFQLHFSYTSAIFQLNFIRTIFQIFFSYIMLCFSFI